MDKFQTNQPSHDSGIVTRIGSPGFEDDDSSTESGSVMYRWEQAQQSNCETTYPTHRGKHTQQTTSHVFALHS